MVDLSEFTVRGMRRGDAGRAASIQASCFPDEFQTRMGIRYSRCFYRFLVADPLSSVSVVERNNDGRVVGIVAITYNPRLYLALMLRHPVTVLGGLFQCALFGWRGRQALVEKFGRIPQAFGNIHKATSDTPSEISPSDDKETPARLIHIALEHGARGGGNAKNVAQHCIADTWRAPKVSRIMSFIKKDNVASREFFRKLGWRFAIKSDGHYYIWIDRPAASSDPKILPR